MSTPMIEQPLIINMCPTGIVPKKAHNGATPVSRAEIVDTVLQAAELGVQMMHLHARDDEENATSDPQAYGPILSDIRADSNGKNLTLCVTTSGRKEPELAKRAAVLDLDGDARPDMGSLTLSSLNFMSQASVNAPDTIRGLAERMKERGIKPELEVFDLGMANFANVLIREGLIEPPYYFNILLGNIATGQATVSHLSAIVNDLPEGAIWSLAGVGRFQKTMNAMGIAVAHGVRVGLEDNLWKQYAPERIPASNIDLVKGVVDAAEAVGRPLDSCNSVRDRLGLSRR